MAFLFQFLLDLFGHLDTLLQRDEHCFAPGVVAADLHVVKLAVEN
jgi:hypothetical protein